MGSPAPALVWVVATASLLVAAIQNLACVAYQAEATWNPVRLYPGRGSCISRDCPMKAFVFALACLIPLAAFAAEEDAIMQKAFRIITQQRLLSRAELACSSLVLEDTTKTAATVTVREKHGGKCGGDPETAPRRFTMEIDLRTGTVHWDNNDEMEMKPIPDDFGLRR